MLASVNLNYKNNFQMQKLVYALTKNVPLLSPLSKQITCQGWLTYVNQKLDKILSHACEVDADGFAIRVLCGKVKLESICDSETTINIALIAELTPTTLSDSTIQLKRFETSFRDFSSIHFDNESLNSGWGYNKDCKEQVTRTVDVLRVSKLHKDINLSVLYIQIID